MHRHFSRSFAATGTTALLAAALLTAPGAYAAAATTCQGKTVTIDGTGQPVVTGTPANDVIAASVGSTVTALAGDDTICILPGTATTPTSVDAGEGADSVDTSTLAAQTSVTTMLGTGGDTYAGGAGNDMVNAAPGADTVTTGAGDDSVDSGVAGQPNEDKIDLGAGDDELTSRGVQAPAGSADFGDGTNTLVDAEGGVVAINATNRTVQRNGDTVLRWQGSVTTYVVESTATAVSFDGTNDNETLVLRDPVTGATPTLVDADMAAGDDAMTIRSRILDGSTWDGGDGTDLFQVAFDYDKLYLDLRSGQFETGTPDVTVDQRVSRVENVDAVTTAVTVKGNDAGNVLNLKGCSIAAVGRAGADTVSSDIIGAPAVTCASTKMVARGGKDDDTITGTVGADRLFGNKGMDMVRAKSGNDVIFGGDEDDRIKGQGGDDKVRGGKGDDELAGNAGNDRVQGDQGNDRLLAHAGNDVLVGGLGFDRANGGEGFDRCSAVERSTKCER